MAAGILSRMEGKLGIRAWRWYVFPPHFPYSYINITAQAVLYRGIEYILGILQLQSNVTPMAGSYNGCHRNISYVCIRCAESQQRNG